MRIDLRVAGPGLQARRVLRAGEPQVVLGRDADCDIPLPDPQRTVSRRHLALWVEHGELHFQVLSVVNGIEMPFGEAPPGARGVLPAGETLKVGEYVVSFSGEWETLPGGAPAPAAAEDPWAVFDRDDSGIARPVHVAPAAPTEDDPFSDWGFESTFGPQHAPIAAASLGAGDASAFFRGLGLRQGPQGPMTEGELETIGRLVRMLGEAVLELHGDVQAARDGLRAGDRTTVAPRGAANPLRGDWNTEAKLRFLFGGIGASSGGVGPERALRDLLLDLAAHNEATVSSVRDAVEATLLEFRPEELKARLLGGGGRLFEGARAWEAFSRDYEARAADLPAWTRQLLDKHFTEAYVREIQRLKRETGAGNG